MQNKINKYSIFLMLKQGTNAFLFFVLNRSIFLGMNVENSFQFLYKRVKILKIKF